MNICYWYICFLPIYKYISPINLCILENSLVVQWLELGASAARGLGSIPGQGTKILQAMQPKEKKIYLF